MPFADGQRKSILRLCRQDHTDDEDGYREDHKCSEVLMLHMSDLHFLWEQRRSTQ